MKNLLAGVEGLEPPASGFGDQRSSQLSYTPMIRFNDTTTILGKLLYAICARSVKVCRDKRERIKNGYFRAISRLPLDVERI